MFPDVDRINPEYFRSIDRKIDHLNPSCERDRSIAEWLSLGWNRGRTGEVRWRASRLFTPVARIQGRSQQIRWSVHQMAACGLVPIPALHTSLLRQDTCDAVPSGSGLGDQVMCLQVGREGVVWVETNRGLYLLETVLSRLHGASPRP